MEIIKLKNLTKKYGDLFAVDNISLNVKEGEIYGLLGPNGAGKSTTISMLCGLVNQTEGEIFINGKDFKKYFNEARKIMGFVPQNIAIYEKFSARENISFFGELYGLRGKMLKESVNKALELTGLTDCDKKSAIEFSGGMKRRLNIACAIVHNPKIIIMDEPTVGIDAQSRNHILQSIKKLNENGATIIYTTHYMEEVESICSKIAIVDHGKLIVEGTKEELKNIISDKKSLRLVLGGYEEIDKDDIKKIKGIVNIKESDGEIIITTDKAVNNLDKILSYFADKNIPITDIGYKEVTLETVFLTLTGRSLRE